MGKLGVSLVVVLLAVVVCCYSEAAMGVGSIPVGGRMKVKDVKSNEDIQKLGRYSIEQYNLQLQKSTGDNSSGRQLQFKEVVEAERQVVSGIKYYLKVEAKTAFGLHETYDAVVLVKPWTRSKELLHFRYSSTHTTE